MPARMKPAEIERRQIFVTGGTGYIGRPLIEVLAARGHAVTALVRPGSEKRLHAPVAPVIGDALEPSSFEEEIAPGATFVHLIGTAHPNPSKAAQFRAVDLRSIEAAMHAARHAGIAHFVYVSVAHPAPVMRAYIEVRRKGEALIRESGLNATILRPWYVLGPGHRWPAFMLPIYALLETIPATRAGALRLGLVKLRDMVSAMVAAIEQPPQGVRVLGVPEIRGSLR